MFQKIALCDSNESLDIPWFLSEGMMRKKEGVVNLWIYIFSLKLLNYLLKAFVFETRGSSRKE